MGKTRPEVRRETLCVSCYYLCPLCAGIPIEQRPWVRQFESTTYKKDYRHGRKPEYTVHQVNDCDKYRPGRYPLQVAF